MMVKTWEGQLAMHAMGTAHGQTGNIWEFSLPKSDDNFDKLKKKLDWSMSQNAPVVIEYEEKPLMPWNRNRKSRYICVGVNLAQQQESDNPFETQE